jgi:bifunctional UDP-N-acetylglucosamine pyrophosphorylase/glucosamine-1-phosphate N-acetyltransferase
MRSRIPKVLHSLCGRSMLGHALAAAAGLGPERLVVVTGHGRDQVSAEAARCAPDVRVVVQDRLGGTGHAVRMVTEALGDLPGIVVVTYADMPLLRTQTLAALIREHAAAGNAVTVLTARVPDPSGYGRIIRDDGGSLAEIVEDADATAAQRAIDEINSGCYAFDGALLADAVKRVATSNAQGQEYLTDVVAIMRGDGHLAGTVLAADAAEVQGVNDRVQLAQAQRAFNGRLLEDWMRAGVTIMDPSSTWMDVDVTLAPDAEVLPGTHLEGRTDIGTGARIGPDCLLRDTSVGQDATVLYSVCESAEIGPGASVGPYARLRPGTRIGPGAHIGTHVELKNSTVGEGAKVPHLTYVGDADIGEHSNIGAATIFANYDGVAKHHTTIGSNVFIGSDTVLVAPLTIGDGAYTAAGSVITEDVPPGALGIARGGAQPAGWVSGGGPAPSPGAAAPPASRTQPDLGERRGRGGAGQVSETMPPGAKKMLLVSGRAYPELAEEVAACLGIKPTPTKLFDFANGEIFVRFLDSVRGCDVFALQSHTSPINEWIMEQLIMVDALKRASARRITVVTPFFGYARQDKKNRGREPISARLMTDLFATAGASRLMAVDLHTAQIQGFFDGPVDHLFALPILASYIEKKLDLSQVTVVAPDAGRVRVCERWTDRLGTPLAIIHKRRDPDVANQVRMFEVVGQVAGRTCILVDDMIDTGATIAKAADALFEQGADRVIATATHGVLSGGAVDILKNSRISEIIITNTLPVPQEKRFDKLTVLSIAPLLARAINEVFSDGSVTSLFDGQS